MATQFIGLVIWRERRNRWFSVMRYRFFITFVFLWGILLARASWPVEGEGLAVDPQVRWGVLENGFRYAILPNKEPPECVSMQLFVDAGSLMEKEGEEGLAHFLEHMAFNGSQNFQPGELVEFFQRIGMAFGADVNAGTGFDSTVYKIDLPENTTNYLQEGFRVFRDFADGLLLLQPEIDREKGVILSERRARDTVGYRRFCALWKFLFPQSLLSKRFPIGQVGVIEEATQTELSLFYHKWYRPDRMVLVVVGDVSPDKTERCIRRCFQKLQLPVDPVKEPDLGAVVPLQPKSFLQRDPDASEVSISLFTLSSVSEVGDSLEERKRDFFREIANQIVTYRLERLAQKKGIPIASGEVCSLRGLRFFALTEMEVGCRLEEWKEALGVLEQELRRALTYGFTRAEVEEVKANFFKAYEQAEKEVSTRNTRELVGALVGSIQDESVFTSPGAEFEMAKEWLKEVSPAVCKEAFCQQWDAERYLFMSGNIGEGVGDEALWETYRASEWTAIEPLEEQILPDFTYNHFGDEGQEVGRQVFEDLKITQIQFDNNVWLNWKKTSFEANKVRVVIQFGGGLLEASAEKPALPLLAGEAFLEGGLGRHSWEELERILAGKNLSLSFAVGEEAFVLSIETDKEDLPIALAVATAYLVDPGYRSESLRMARKNFDKIYRNLENTPEGVLADKVSRFLGGGDFRFGYPPREVAMNSTLEELKEWLSVPLKEGFLEVSVVGDFEEENLVKHMAVTLGAIPKREEQAKSFLKERTSVHFPSTSAATFTVESSVKRAISAAYWPTVDAHNVRLMRCLSLLSEVFKDKLRIQVRQELGETYSPYAYSTNSEVFKDYGFFCGLCLVDPQQADAVLHVILENAETLSESMNEEALDRARKPILSDIKERKRSNVYWLCQVLMGAKRYPEKMERARSLRRDYQTITLEEIRQVASRFLKKETSVRVLIVPRE